MDVDASIPAGYHISASQILRNAVCIGKMPAKAVQPGEPDVSIAVFGQRRPPLAVHRGKGQDAPRLVAALHVELEASDGFDVFQIDDDGL